MRTSDDALIGGSDDLTIAQTVIACHPERARAEAIASRRLKNAIPLTDPVPGSSLEKLRRFWGIVRATIREIFGENAYDRFLARTHATRSTESYRKFLRERDEAIERRPRCC